MKPHEQENKLFAIKVGVKVPHSRKKIVETRIVRPVNGETYFNQVGLSQGFIHFADIEKKQCLGYQGIANFDETARPLDLQETVKHCFDAVYNRMCEMFIQTAEGIAGKRQLADELEALIAEITESAAADKAYQEGWCRFVDGVNGMVACLRELKEIAVKEMPATPDAQAKLGSEIQLLKDGIDYGYITPDSYQHGGALDLALDKAFAVAEKVQPDIHNLHVLLRECIPLISNAEGGASIHQAYVHVNGDISIMLECPDDQSNERLQATLASMVDSSQLEELKVRLRPHAVKRQSKAKKLLKSYVDLRSQLSPEAQGISEQVASDLLEKID